MLSVQPRASPPVDNEVYTLCKLEQPTISERAHHVTHSILPKTFSAPSHDMQATAPSATGPYTRENGSTNRANGAEQGANNNNKKNQTPTTHNGHATKPEQSEPADMDVDVVEGHGRAAIKHICHKYRIPERKLDQPKWKHLRKTKQLNTALVLYSVAPLLVDNLAEVWCGVVWSAGGPC